MTAPNPAAAGAAIDHAVSFNVFAGGARNAELQGDGRLRIDPAGPTYVFSGRARQLFAGGTKSVRFTAAEITNVVVQDRLVQFQPRRAGVAATAAPFVFYARDAAEAQAIASLMPADKDEIFVAEESFFTRLNTLAGARGPFGWATNVLVALNVAAFLFLTLVLGAEWFEVTDLRPYVIAGANNGAATTDGEWWRLVTSMFLHYGVIHLVLNMWALLAAGHLLEKLLGTRLFTLTYLGAGLAGGFASIAWYGDAVWSAGASGAVFGVFGGVLGFMLRQRDAVPRTIFRRLLRSSLLFAGYNIFFGLARSGIDNAAHAGGFFSGIALGWLLARPLEAVARRALAAGRLALGAGLLGIILAAGVTGTPRFDYRLADEFALHDANEQHAPREQDLLRRNREALSQMGAAPAAGPAAAAHAAWIEQEMLPFYRNWGAAVRTLELDPTRGTHRRRESLVRIFDLRTRSLERLAGGLRSGRADTLSQFHLDDAEIVAAIARLNENGTP